LYWYEQVSKRGFATDSNPISGDSTAGEEGSQSSLEQIASYIPRTMLQPFSSNNVIGVVVLALVLGALLRRLHPPAHHSDGTVEAIVQTVEGIYHWLVRILWWIICLVPFAVFGVLPNIVGRGGIGVLSIVGIFLAAILAGLTLHACLYYPSLAWLVGKKSPKTYFGQGADAITTAISCNSSLATVPVTLRCLDRMRVSPESARLAACVGT